MAFNINTNIHAINSHAQGTFVQASLQNSLERLSSGLRINKAADDASGMAIADSLRSQANSLGQAMRNANDTIGIIQIADKAMDEQVKILDTIKTKSVQAAQDGQTTKTRIAIQADINRLINSLDNIANTTSYNGLSLLAGSFTNKKFQIGAYSNQTVNLTIGATNSSKIGHVRFETTSVTAMGDVKLQFLQINGGKDVTLESVVLSTSAGTGLGALAEVINKNSDLLGGVRATYTVQAVGFEAVQAGSIQGLTINGVYIGDVTDIKANDSDGKLVQAINARKIETGVEASIDASGALRLNSPDGRGFYIGADGITAVDPNVTNLTEFLSMGDVDPNVTNYISRIGMLTLNRHDPSDIKIANLGAGADSPLFSGTNNLAEATINLRDVLGEFSIDVRSAVGAILDDDMSPLGIPVTTLHGAMAVMDIAESAMSRLNAIRADLGSAQQQVQSTLNNITITQVNVKAAESNIRETDFAEESSTYSKLNILAQAGNYAIAQSTSTQQNILRLLQ
ncbi:flagellin B [Helicobacter monodelphidis]|uniref:flagellin B n=1 Tax=Helicobacter sp. 15-1451 TaxID=2004995 RepID=UPI000DCE4902|nr:flagellin B [Helicobacter sp. 15-1451]RAX57671.1 flagellin B [Helicobacter sp. 15-1451]